MQTLLEIRTNTRVCICVYMDIHLYIVVNEYTRLYIEVSVNDPHLEFKLSPGAACTVGDVL